MAEIDIPLNSVEDYNKAIAEVEALWAAFAHTLRQLVYRRELMAINVKPEQVAGLIHEEIDDGIGKRKPSGRVLGIERIGGERELFPSPLENPNNQSVSPISPELRRRLLALVSADPGCNCFNCRLHREIIALLQ